MTFTERSCRESRSLANTLPDMTTVEELLAAKREPIPNGLRPLPLVSVTPHCALAWHFTPPQPIRATHPALLQQSPPRSAFGFL